MAPWIPLYLAVSSALYTGTWGLFSVILKLLRLRMTLFGFLHPLVDISSQGTRLVESEEVVLEWCIKGRTFSLSLLITAFLRSSDSKSFRN